MEVFYYLWKMRALSRCQSRSFSVPQSNQSTLHSGSHLAVFAAQSSAMSLNQHARQAQASSELQWMDSG